MNRVNQPYFSKFQVGVYSHVSSVTINCCFSRWRFSEGEHFELLTKCPEVRDQQQLVLLHLNRRDRYAYLSPSKIEWDLSNGPLSKLLELLDTQV